MTFIRVEQKTELGRLIPFALAAIATLGRRAHTDPFETIDALLVGRPVNSANRPFQTDRNLPFQFVF